MNTQSLYILVVEDQQNIAQNIAEYMENKGHVLDFATQGEQGFKLALANHYDVVILDLNLPVMSGLEVCTQLRLQASHHVPIIMLTARDSIEDKISGFTTGADDYLTKPFSLEELEVRCLALSRRHLLQTNHILTFDKLVIDRKKQLVTREEKPLELHTMGYRILTILAEAFPQVVSRSTLSQKLWGDEPTESDALRSHIYQLRNTLDKPFDYPMIKTLHGIGFVLDVKK
ncbi:response regulator transcription factor [Psychrosphaera sp. B3R10]|uniref:Response regulator transcription factor n=1 Tax=Psychrosphaera algicola TaxID=3023714 RepID=A0ABT5FEH5_9GAMM|nr:MULTISPECIES: response regulator transcription factor [unclassified Psychrosphaera]MBU2881978.1 response regulator transcription factor [Psychrosphaera sp. I2R16]MBU2988712.1 response regulator transcription factor [Psychrosphaera sp. B3R10]MDC2888996.1 response regulator transcription factor [Psychrosphaera sp. G1-22]MDO6719198.1 response regulator transcription factor [Psychrosphaera sp. 1_MG-2023]